MSGKRLRGVAGGLDGATQGSIGLSYSLEKTANLEAEQFIGGGGAFFVRLGSGKENPEGQGLANDPPLGGGGLLHPSGKGRG